MRAPTRNLASYTSLLLAQTTVGVSIVGSKWLVGSLSPITLLHARFIISFLLLMGLHCLFGKEKLAPLKSLDKKSWGFIIAQALFAGALFNLLLLGGLQLTSASVAGIISSTLPAIIAILSVLFLKERLRPLTALCIGFSVLGLVAINLSNVIHDTHNSLLGDALVLLSLLPEAGYYVLVKVHKTKLPVFLVAALMNGLNIPVFSLLIGLGHYPLLPPLNLHEIAVLALLGVTSAAFYVFWFLGYRKIEGSAAGLTTAFVPIVTLVVAWLALSESVTLLQFMGMILVMASIGVNAYAQSNQRALKAPSRLGRGPSYPIN